MGLFDGIGGFADEVVPKILADLGVLPIHELVRRVHAGDASKWHEAVTTANEIVNAHHEASDRSRKLLQVLESSWTGAGAEAAAQKILMGARATQASAEVYAMNARVYTDSAHTFDTIKHELPPVAEKPPERGVIDVLTPWDTDTEKQINQHNADVERARQIYETYERHMQAAQQSVVTDFGSLGSFDGELGTIERDESGNGDDAGSGIRRFDEPTPSSRESSPSSVASVPTGQPSSPTYSTPHVPTSPVPNSNTSASGYVTPDVGRPPAATPPNYPTPSINPNPNVGPGGSNPYQPPTFGPPGTPTNPGPGSGPGRGPGRFAVPGGGPGPRGGMPGGGMPGGGAAPGGPGVPGAGRTVGAAPFGPTGGGGPAGFGPSGPGGAGAAAGARGGMPMGAMGGAGAGRGGQGGDEEHQRQYVQATDEAFALTENGEVLRDPTTGNVVAPPTIGG